MNEQLDTLKKKYPVVQAIERVVQFTNFDEKRLTIEDGCDNWFMCELNAEEVLQLAEFLKELANSMR